MLYIIAGKYKGFKFHEVPSMKTRSTSHLLRKAVFDTIREFVDGSIVLDLFSGSGAYGFEALSRNAKKVYLVDNFFLAFKTIEKNIKKINFNKEQIQLFFNDAFKMLKTFIKKELIFDLIILDPPYFYDFYFLLFQMLDKVTHDKSLIVLETHYKTALTSSIDNFLLFKEKKYGNKKINYFHKKLFF